MAQSFRRARHEKARLTYKLFVYGLVLIMLILVIKDALSICFLHV